MTKVSWQAMINVLQENRCGVLWENVREKCRLRGYCIRPFW